jgi:hypothetical protein
LLVKKPLHDNCLKKKLEHVHHFHKLLELLEINDVALAVTPSCSEPPTIVYSTTAVTATPDNHISIEPPHYTSVIVKDFETTDIPKPTNVHLH